MSKIEDGGPAFSGTYSARCDQGRGSVVEFHDKGMSLRDYFAAKVYAATISGGYWPLDTSREEQADMAYKHADAMIAARNKESSQ